MGHDTSSGFLVPAKTLLCSECFYTRFSSVVSSLKPYSRRCPSDFRSKGRHLRMCAVAPLVSQSAPPGLAPPFNEHNRHHSDDGNAYDPTNDGDHDDPWLQERGRLFFKRLGNGLAVNTNFLSPKIFFVGYSSSVLTLLRRKTLLPRLKTPNLRCQLNGES